MFVVPSGGEGSLSQEGSLANILGQEKVKFLLVYVILTGIQAFHYNHSVLAAILCSASPTSMLPASVIPLKYYCLKRLLSYQHLEQRR